MKKTGKRFIIVIFFISMIFYSCLIDNSKKSSSSSYNTIGNNDSKMDIYYSEDWMKIVQDDFIIYNNVWGKGSITNYKQIIFQENSDSLCPFGWEWDWPQNSDGNVKAYPEIYIGKEPWSALPSSNTDKLPIALKDINNFTAKYDIESTKSGRYNLALEFWLTSEAEPNEGNITTEVMIWLDYNDWQWFPRLVEKVTIDGEEYNFYKGNVSHGNWSYICFAKVIPEYTGETKIHEFINYLIANNHINPDDYLSCLDFGNEIIYGKGKTKFLEYSVILN